MNYLMLSVGRRGELLKDFRQSIAEGSKLVATDLSPYAPAIYYADKQYLVPRIEDPKYIDTILEICKAEHIHAVTTFIDPEIEVLAHNRDKFTAIGVEVLAPYEETAKLCFNKYLMFQHKVSLKWKYTILRKRIYMSRYSRAINRVSDEEYTKALYRIVFGEELRLNPPVTYNEHLCKLKIDDDGKSLAKYVDKYAVREYIASTIGKEYLNTVYLLSYEKECRSYLQICR